MSFQEKNLEKHSSSERPTGTDLSKTKELRLNEDVPMFFFLFSHIGSEVTAEDKTPGFTFPAVSTHTATGKSQTHLFLISNLSPLSSSFLGIVSYVSAAVKSITCHFFSVYFPSVFFFNCPVQSHTETCSDSVTAGGRLLNLQLSQECGNTNQELLREQHCIMGGFRIRINIMELRWGNTSSGASPIRPLWSPTDLLPSKPPPGSISR